MKAVNFEERLRRDIVAALRKVEQTRKKDRDNHITIAHVIFANNPLRYAFIESDLFDGYDILVMDTRTWTVSDVGYLRATMTCGDDVCGGGHKAWDLNLYKPCLVKADEKIAIEKKKRYFDTYHDLFHRGKVSKVRFPEAGSGLPFSWSVMIGYGKGSTPEANAELPDFSQIAPCFNFGAYAIQLVANIYDGHYHGTPVWLYDSMYTDYYELIERSPEHMINNGVKPDLLVVQREDDVILLSWSKKAQQWLTYDRDNFGNILEF